MRLKNNNNNNNKTIKELTKYNESPLLLLKLQLIIGNRPITAFPALTRVYSGDSRQLKREGMRRGELVARYEEGGQRRGRAAAVPRKRRKRRIELHKNKQ